MRKQYPYGNTTAKEFKEKHEWYPEGLDFKKPRMHSREHLLLLLRSLCMKYPGLKHKFTEKMQQQGFATEARIAVQALINNSCGRWTELFAN